MNLAFSSALALRSARKAKRKDKATRISGRRRPKKTLARLKDDLWALLSPLVKQRDGNVCFSCRRANLEGSGWHAGHMFAAGSHNILRFDPLNIHSQCFHCNINLGGNGAAYAHAFIRYHGDKLFCSLERQSREIKKWKPYELEMLIGKAKEGLDSYAEYYHAIYLETP